MWGLLPPTVLLLWHLSRPSWAECPPSQAGNDTGPCNCVTANRIFGDCLHCPPELGCQCNSSTKGLLNVTDFYAGVCTVLPSNAIYVAMVVPIMGFFLIIALTYFLLRTKKGAPLAHDKRPSDDSEEQPRYVDQARPRDHQPGDYENILVDQGDEGPSDRSRRQSRMSSKKRPTRQPDSAGIQADHPIYANTQNVYYNYTGKQARRAQEEDLYIAPDE